MKKQNYSDCFLILIECFFIISDIYTLEFMKTLSESDQTDIKKGMEFLLQNDTCSNSTNINITILDDWKTL
jgi:hypothetical protein